MLNSLTFHQFSTEPNQLNLIGHLIQIYSPKNILFMISLLIELLKWPIMISLIQKVHQVILSL